MVPAAFVDSTIASLEPLLASGDIGHRRRQQHVARRHRSGRAPRAEGAALRRRRHQRRRVRPRAGLLPDDRRRGRAPSHALAPIFASLAPGVERRPAPGAGPGEPTPAEQGWLHCGPAGAGHFVKMVHNGIEYGLMAAYAEGLNVLHHAGIGLADHVQDAETAPLREPGHYQYDIDIASVAELWRRGSVVASWLLDLTADALAEDPQLGGVRGPGLRQRRGPLDRAGGDRRRCARAGAEPPRSTPGSRPATTTTSPTRCSRRCARSSVATPRSTP